MTDWLSVVIAALALVVSIHASWRVHILERPKIRVELKVIHEPEYMPARFLDQRLDEVDKLLLTVTHVGSGPAIVLDRCEIELADRPPVVIVTDFEQGDRLPYRLEPRTKAEWRIETRLVQRDARAIGRAARMTFVGVVYDQTETRYRSKRLEVTFESETGR